MTDPPTWTEEPGGSAYTLIDGGVRGRIWRRLGKWETIVNNHGGFLSAGNFPRAEEAKAWCEARSAERSAHT